MDKLITIGKLAKLYGISTRTIRHYEDFGLLKCADNTEASYRLYGEKEIKRLEKICLLKNLGFSLEEILTILNSDSSDSIERTFKARLNEFENKISELSNYKEMLTAVIKLYNMKGIDYLNNYNLMKEVICVNNKFIKIFSKLDTSIQTEILIELFNTGTLSPETIKKMGNESGTWVLNEIHTILVKEIVNKLDRVSEKNIIGKLENTNPDFAEKLKKAMFTFEDIITLPDGVISKWLVRCKDEELAAALKESNSYVRRRICNNMSIERKEKINNMVENSGEKPIDEVYSAMNNLVEILQKMDISREITME